MSGAMMRVYMECMLQVLGESKALAGLVPHCTQIRANKLPMPFVCVATSTRCCVDAWPPLGWAKRRNMRRALQRSLLTLGLTVVSQGLERECFAANSQARFETAYVKHHQEVHAEVLDALSRHLPRPSQHCAAYATLRKSLPELHRFRALGGTLAVPPTDDVQVPPPVVSGATDAMERTVPNRR